jgi:hypothetical protein
MNKVSGYFGKRDDDHNEDLLFEQEQVLSKFLQEDK